MEIDEQLMGRLDAGLTEKARVVPLGDTGLSAKVMSASFVQFTDALNMLAEYVDLEQTAREVLGDGLDDSALVARLVAVIQDAPQLRDRWIELMQPHCNVDLGRLTVFMFAAVAVEFLASSFDAAGDQNWSALGNRLAPVRGGARVGVEAARRTAD